MSDSNAYNTAHLCKFGICTEIATHRYVTSRRLSHCKAHANAKMMPSPLEERCVRDGCLLIAIYKYDYDLQYTHCYYHKRRRQHCEPAVCGIRGTVATFKCSKTNMLYCKTDRTPTSFNMKINHCHDDVQQCAKIDLDHCKKIKHHCIVFNCRSMANHYIYELYPTHCYRHSSRDYTAYNAMLSNRLANDTPINDTPINTPIATPINDTPINTQIDTPIATPVVEPIAAPIATPINTPIATPVVEPIATSINDTPINTPIATPINDTQIATIEFNPDMFFI